MAIVNNRTRAINCSNACSESCYLQEWVRMRSNPLSPGKGSIHVPLVLSQSHFDRISTKGSHQHPESLDGQLIVATM